MVLGIVVLSAGLKRVIVRAGSVLTLIVAAALVVDERGAAASAAATVDT
jgi:hypothetical protein